ncbi:hypothetical protein ACP70R_010049 [Stipagrostis hirtigluma subsp. patula]
MEPMKTKLGDMKLEFVANIVRDGETVVEQLFFHDPDGNVIEICDCEKLPVIPLGDAPAGGHDHKQLLAGQRNVHG